MALYSELQSKIKTITVETLHPNLTVQQVDVELERTLQYTDEHKITVWLESTVISATVMGGKYIPDGHVWRNEKDGRLVPSLYEMLGAAVWLAKRKVREF